MSKKEKAISKEFGLKLLSDMHRSRKFEEQVQKYFSLGMIHGTTHLGIGEEATAAGTVAGLEERDEIITTHRGHSQIVCKGVDVNLMMAEIFAKETGVCKGRGGSMHICDQSKGVWSGNGILGSAPPIACGIALTRKKKGEDKVTTVFFGDGSTNEGGFHEAMNLAAAWSLPVLFVCINNTYGMSTHISKVMKNTNISDRAAGYGMKAMDVDGNDVLAVYETIKEARKYIGEGNGPVLVVEHSYRISGHSKSDGNLYRTKEEIAAWREKCPIKRLKAYLLENGIATEEEMAQVEADATKALDDAVQYAIDSPYPSLDTVLDDVYAD